jgi:inhibitor of KinA
MEITPLGDSALIVRVAASFERAPDETLSAVLAVQRRLEDAQLPGVVEIALAYTTVAVFFDPIRVLSAGGESDRLFDWLADRIGKTLSDVRDVHIGKIETRTMEVPVCYETGFALDLDEVARHAGVHRKEVIDLHCGAEYRVHCVGFTPGFPFLSGLPEKLATPRRAVPRKEIPAGSVAIGRTQTGIYPLKSPGGWNVIGRTPMCLFDPKKNPPALLRAGDHVRFHAITREQFEKEMQC